MCTLISYHLIMNINTDALQNLFFLSINPWGQVEDATHISDPAEVSKATFKFCLGVPIDIVP